MNERVSLGLRWTEKSLQVLDQSRLPHEEIWMDCRSAAEMVDFIRALKIRGAPLIGVAAAAALALEIKRGGSDESFSKCARELREARPTAVNLMAAIDRMTAASKSGWAAAISTAENIFDEDVSLCSAMAKHGADLIEDGEGILTHCNTGGLATAGVGTALAAIKEAHAQGKKIHVFVDETRPLLQGGQLTTWELHREQIPHTLLCDSMAAALMSTGKIQRVLVGSDRIARNGDVANKVGTYMLAVLAHHHRIPFVVVAPRTTLDPLCGSGKEIPIEERAPEEVRRDWAPRTTPVFNPAFDVTPAKLVSSYVLDSGVYTNPTDLPFEP